jgi:ABC-type transport system substrate-binding protein
MTQIGEVVADFWTKVGVQVTIQNVEWGTFQPMMRGDLKGLVGNASMFRTAGRPVAESRYQSALHSDSETHLLGDPQHCPTACQEFDRLHPLVLAERDEAKRTALMNRLVELVANTWIAVPIIEGMGFWAVNPKLVGEFAAIPGRHEFGDVFERMPRPEQRPWR